MFLSTKAGLFAIGALSSGFLSLASLGFITFLWQSLPDFIYTSPGGAIMNLADEANRSEFDRLRIFSTWTLCFGPFLTGFCLASTKKLGSQGFLASCLTTLFLTVATLIVSASMWSLTHIQGGNWHLSGHSPVESYGKHPIDVLNFQVFFTVASGLLHTVAFFSGLIWTNEYLKRESRLTEMACPNQQNGGATGRG